jgi:hypothetical protein
MAVRLRAEHGEPEGKAFAMEHFGRSEPGCTVADGHDAVRMLRRLLPGAPLSYEGFATASLALLSRLQCVC